MPELVGRNHGPAQLEATVSHRAAERRGGQRDRADTPDGTPADAAPAEAGDHSGVGALQVSRHGQGRDAEANHSSQHDDGKREEPPAASRFDPSIAHPARVYDYWLGGKDNFQPDRVVGEAVIRLRPGVVADARANRAFLGRVVRFLATECGIRQFLDVGAGLPASDNTHHVAQQVAPECRVVYVDSDPIVMAHARALLTSSPPGACDYIEADLSDTATIVAQAAQTLSLAQPVAVLLLAVLHFVVDADNPGSAVAALADTLVPGSYIAVSHLTADFAPELVGAASTAYNTLSSVPITPRTHTQVTALLGGLPLVAPGVVPVSEWRRDHHSVSQPTDVYAGLARIPGTGR